MAFIKAQKLTYDNEGGITGGSAAIVDTIYGDFGSYHAKHRVREKLGKVLFLSSDKKTGIFLSPTRGLVMCFRNRDGMVTVETPGKKVRQYYILAGIDIPAHVDTARFIKNIFNIKM